MIRKMIPVVAVIALATSLNGQSVQQVELAREKIQQWVQTRQTISRERTEWRVQQEFLEATRDLLQQELESIESSLAALEEGETVADTQRANLTEERDGLDAATAAVRDKIADLEVLIRSYVPMLPQALVTQIDPLLRRIPENPYNPGRMSVGERLPNIVGVLQAVNRFDSTLHLFRDAVEFDGREIQVDVLYWGLGIAYFVDQNNTYAGYKYPTPQGWRSVEMSEVAPAVRKVVDMYQRRSPNIEFVELPAAIN